MAARTWAPAARAAADGEARRLHEWRVARLTRLGMPESVAEFHADNVDWHQVARLVRSGCPPRPAAQPAVTAARITRPGVTTRARAHRDAGAMSGEP